MKLILRTENRIEDHEQQIGHQKVTLYENHGNLVNLRGGRGLNRHWFFFFWFNLLVLQTWICLDKYMIT